MQLVSGTLLSSTKAKLTSLINSTEPALDIIGRWLGRIYEQPTRFVPYSKLHFKQRVEFWSWIIGLGALITFLGAALGTILAMAIYAFVTAAPNFCLFIAILTITVLTLSGLIKIRKSKDIDNENSDLLGPSSRDASNGVETSTTTS